MPQEETNEQVEAAASAWVARVDAARLNAHETERLEGWLAGSARRRGAYARAQAALAFMNADFVRDINTRAPRVSRRRALWTGGIAAAAAAAASVAYLIAGGQAPPATYSAQRGQIRVVSLPDGSLITLDTASTVSVQLLPRERRVQLVKGRALFTVAKDKSRPFVVSAQGFKVEAIGTSFAVGNSAKAPVEVLVQEGIIEVGRTSEAGPVRVGANMRVVASATAALSVTAVDPATVLHELVWRQGMIAFEDVSLAVAAEEFARYADARIVFADPAIAAVTITGLFAANNPLGFARSAALSLGLKLDVTDHVLTLSHP